jgi:O-antigen/teichoic acid export membrane protein
MGIKLIASLKSMRTNLFVANVVKLGGGSALGQLPVVLSMPLLTRLYSPSDMGNFGIFMAFIAFAGVGVALRYDLAIVAASDNLEADLLLISSVVVAVPYCFMASVILFVMMQFDIFGYSALPTWSIFAMFITLLVTGLFSALRFWFVSRGKFSAIGAALLKQGIGRGAIPILFGWLSLGWAGLLSGEILGRMLGIYKLSRFAWVEVRKNLNLLNTSKIMLVLRKYWKYPAVFLPSSLVDALASTLPLPVIYSLFDAAAAGQYFLAYRLTSLPTGLISAGAADVFHARIVEAVKIERASVRHILKIAIFKLGLIGIAIYLPMAVISPFVFNYVFGDSWQVAGLLMSILSIACITGVVTGSLSRALTVSKFPELKFLSDTIRLFFPVSGIWVCHFFGMNFILTMGIFVILSMISEVIYMYVIWVATSECRLIKAY